MLRHRFHYYGAKSAPLRRRYERPIALDPAHGEQLSPNKDAHQPIFRLLKNAVVTARPPHRLTYIVAFRRDYAPTWLDFQYDQLGRYQPMMMPLRLFNEEQAKEIIAIIADAAKFSVDIALVDDLITSMKNDEARISPVDIGITLLALNERALAKADRHLNKGDYQIAGGATGLLADYVSNRLERYRADERSSIVQSMLELADLSKDQRLAQGLLPDQLADKARLPVAIMQRYLNDLASPQVRLLELLSPPGAYRLSHERLIPSLRQLAGLVLAEAEQTGRIFNRAYGDWVAGQRSRKLLLGGRSLSDVVKYRDQLHWATDRDDKEMFLKRSLTWRVWRRAMAGVATAALLAVGSFGWNQFNVWQDKRDLAAWNLPAALINSTQLTSLSTTNDRLTHLRWLHCGFNELALVLPKVDDIEDLRRCKNLVSLTLGLLGSSVNSLDALKDLKGLTTLALSLRSSRVSSLDALKDLRGLTTLTLNLGGSGVTSLDALKDLKGLTTLTLDLSGSSVSSLDVLKDLKGLTTLTLQLGKSNVVDLLSLESCDRLETLKITHQLRYQLSALPKSLQKLDLDDRDSFQ